MAHSKEAHAKHDAMAQFNADHKENKFKNLETCGLKYTQGEMDNPEHLERSNNALARYAKKNKMKY